MNATRRYWLGALIAIFVVALLARGVYLYQIRDIGFIHQPQSDARVYVERAAGIAAGDVIGPADFVHAPLYAYFLGIIRVLCGENLWWPRIVQIVGGAAGCVVLALLTRRLLDSAAAGIIAGLVLAVYPPAIFFDGLIQKASLTLLLCILALWTTQRAADRATWVNWIVAGVVFGLLILNRQNTLALVPLWLAWLWIEARSLRWPGRALKTAAAVGVLVLTLLPWAARNRVVLGDWVLTTPNLGQNFAMGNHPAGTGTYLPQARGHGSAESEQAGWVAAAEAATGRAMSAAEVSEYYLDAALAWIRANPTAWLRLTGKKLLMTWGSYEAYDTEDYYLYQEHAPLLALLDRGLHFGVIAPFGLAGAVLLGGRSRRLWPLYAWLVLNTLAVAAFVVFARYRLPLVPALVPLAAGGAVAAWPRGWKRTKPAEDAEPPAQGATALEQWPQRATTLEKLATAVVLIVAAIACNWPVHAQRRAEATSYVNHAVALADGGRLEAARAELTRALALNPDHVDAHATLGGILLDQGNAAAARAHFAAAAAGDATFVAAWRGLGDALLALGAVDAAAARLERAVELDPDSALSLSSLGAVRAQQGRLDDAVALLERATALRPDLPQAYVNLGHTYLMLRRYDDAAAAYRRALALDPDNDNVRHNLSILEGRQGRDS
jgi:tetratricopeptide (TPR) repeat protein